MPVSYRALFTGLLVCCLAGCMKKDRKVFNVKYKLTIISPKSTEVFICYKDAGGYVTLITDKDWVQEVCLPSADAASLLIIAERDHEQGYDVFLQQQNISVTGQIVYEERVVSENSGRIVLMSLPVSSL